MSKKPNTKEKAYHLWVMEQGCCVPYCCALPVVAHHVSKRPVYGTLAKPGARRCHYHVAPLCDMHHTKYHSSKFGNVDSFLKAYGVQLEAVAEHYFELYAEHLRGV